MDLLGVAATLLVLLLPLATLPTGSSEVSSDVHGDAAVQRHHHHDVDDHDDYDDDGDVLDIDDVEELWLLGDANVTYSGSQLQEEGRKKIKFKKFKLKKLLFPLLMAYKLKFFALVPLMISGLVLLVGTTGMAGFFFALFAATISIKSNKW